MMIRPTSSQLVLCVPALVCVDPAFALQQAHYGTFYEASTFTAGLYTFDAESAEPQQQAESQDIDDLIANITNEFDAGTDIAEARKWVGRKFYEGANQPLTLAALRLRRGMTQGELAAELGTKQSAISRIEAGREEIGLLRATAMATALDVSLETLSEAFLNTYQAKA